MILRILLIDMFIIAIFMYLLLLGASKCKTAEEIEHEAKLKELERDVIRGLVQARKSQKLSQRVVGERAGVIRETVAKIENNLNSPQINTLIKLLYLMAEIIKVV